MSATFSQNESESINQNRRIENRRDMPTSAAGQGMVLSQQGISATVTGETIGETAKPVTKKRRRYRARRRRCACGCGAVIEHPKTKRQRYVSAAHRQRHFRNKQRRGKKIAPRHQQRDPGFCLHCGHLYWQNPKRGQLFCSAKCRNAAHKAKRTASVDALASYCNMPVEKALDVLDAGGLAWVVSMLTGLGLAYSPESRQWYGSVAVATLKQKPPA